MLEGDTVENDLNIDVALIGRVLERAAPAAPEPVTAGEKPVGAGELGTFILRAAAAGGMYGFLAGRTGEARTRRALLGLCGQERDTEKRLQTEYLLLTGDTLALPPSRPGAPYLLRALRDAYEAELKNAAAYESAAGALPRCALRELYRELAARERAHAALLRGVIGRSVG